MKVQCGHCPAKYAVADERVRDKKVRIRCRRCNAAIVVDGKVSPPLVTSTPARPSAGPGSHAPGLESLPPSTPPADHPRPVAHTIMGGLEAPVTHELMQAHVGGVRPAAADDDGFDDLRGKPDSSRGLTDPPARGEADRWRVALTQQDLRWMTTEEITQAFKDGAVKSETFVFRAGMASWVTLLEVSEIAQALANAHLVSPPLQTLRRNGQEPVEPQRSSSLPPPRKPARPVPSPLAELLSATVDGASEPEESMPFALVAERAGSKRPDAPAAPEPVRSDERDERVEHEHEHEHAPTGAPAATTDGAAPVPAALEPAPVALPADPAPSAASPSALDVGATSVVAPPQKSSRAWLWISLVVLLALAGAALVLGPRFGLRLR